MVRLLIIALIVGCCAYTVSAQFKGVTFAPLGFHQSETSWYENDKYRGPETTLALSFGGTLMPTLGGIIILSSTNINDSKTLRRFGGALIGIGILLGPSIGDFYAHNYLAGISGIGLRTLSGLMAWGRTVAIILGGAGAAGVIVGSLGVMGLISSTIYNWNSAYHSAERYNTAHHTSYKSCAGLLRHGKSTGIGASYSFLIIINNA